MMFFEFSGFIKEIESTASRLTITNLLSELFKKCETNEIGHICYLLSGRVVPLYEDLEFGMADKFVIRGISLAYQLSNSEVVAEFKKAGDLGKVAEVCAQRKSSIHKSKLSVNEVFEKLSEIAQIHGLGSQDLKITKLAELFSEVDPLSARYIARIPLDKLRLGFSEMTILDALSWFIAGDKSLRPKLEESYNVRPDIGHIAQQVKAHGIAGLSHIKAKVGAPILASLCQRIPTADEMIEKMGKVAVEPKYDGVRVQIHYQASKRQGVRASEQSVRASVSSFSRNLENTTQMFPELNEIGKQIDGNEVILDSEAVGLDPQTGKIIPFQETTTRKRKHNIDLFSQQVPIRFYVFDILYKDGVDLLSTPLSQRRQILEKTISKGEILELSPQIVTDNAETLRSYHHDQIKKGLEGAVVKKWESPYTPGRKNFSWVKFKGDEGKTGKLADTIDCVVMGYYLGEGKRSDFGIGAFLVGVKKEEEFVTITKIGTGVSDELWKELLVKFKLLKSKDKPKQYGIVEKALIPDVWIQPELVVEVAGDDLTKSPNHSAGIAIRFPRLVKIRTDKGPFDITTVKELESMYGSQGNQ
jgi:DNA ligase 1